MFFEKKCRREFFVRVYAGEILSCAGMRTGSHRAII